MKKIIKMVSIAAVAIMLPVTAGAEVKSSMEIKNDESGKLKQYITLYDSVSEAAGKKVALKVWKQGVNTENFVPGVNDSEYIAALGQTKADSEGNFSFTFAFNRPYGDDGKYTAEIKIEDKDEIIPVEFAIADVKTVNDFIDKINNKAKLDLMEDSEFDSVFKKGTDYGIESSLYLKMSGEGNTLSQAQKNIISQICAKLENRISENTVTGIEDFKEIFKEKTILGVFATESNGALYESTAEEYADFLKIKETGGIYQTYQALKSKSAALGKIGSCSSVAQFTDGFKESVLVQAVSEASYWADLKEIIENNSDYDKLKSGYDIYSQNESKKEDILKYLIRNKNVVTTVEEFCKLIEKAFAESESTTGIVTSRPSGGGGGGGASRPTSSVSVGGGLSAPASVTPAPAKPEISDISGHWGRNAVEYLVNSGIVSGRPDGTFGPDENITREEFTKLVVLAFNFLNEGDTSEFSDVPVSAWSYPYISSAVKAGLVSGINENSFNPSENIKREDMAVILYRACQRKKSDYFSGELEVKFSDFDSISDYAKNSVSMLSNLGLINGSNGLFNPQSSATRAEAAQMLYNVLKGGE